VSDHLLVQQKGRFARDIGKPELSNARMIPMMKNNYNPCELGSRNMDKPQIQAQATPYG
jgi:hypothetical protein